MDKEKDQLKELWMLLFEDPEKLDDEQIKCLLKAEEELNDFLYYIKNWFPEKYKRVQRYRAKKKELSQLTTDKLTAKHQEIQDEIASVLRRTPEEDLSDYFFMAPPIDSDKHIVCEILEERGII